MSDHRTAELADYVAANELERATMDRFGELTRHGFGFVDIIIRKDGKESRLQGDWLARLFREPVVLRALTAAEAPIAEPLGLGVAAPLISPTN